MENEIVFAIAMFVFGFVFAERLGSHRVNCMIKRIGRQLMQALRNN
jgi:hypothetical protein